MIPALRSCAQTRSESGGRRGSPGVAEARLRSGSSAANSYTRLWPCLRPARASGRCPASIATSSIAGVWCAPARPDSRTIIHVPRTKLRHAKRRPRSACERTTAARASIDGPALRLPPFKIVPGQANHGAAPPVSIPSILREPLAGETRPRPSRLPRMCVNFLRSSPAPIAL
jgi:hypothetical protein